MNPNLLKVSINHKIWPIFSSKTDIKGQILDSFLKWLELGWAWLAGQRVQLGSPKTRLGSITIIYSHTLIVFDRE